MKSYFSFYVLYCLMLVMTTNATHTIFSVVLVIPNPFLVTLSSTVNILRLIEKEFIFFTKIDIQVQYRKNKN